MINFARQNQWQNILGAEDLSRLSGFIGILSEARQRVPQQELRVHLAYLVKALEYSRDAIESFVGGSRAEAVGLVAGACAAYQVGGGRKLMDTCILLALGQTPEIGYKFCAALYPAIERLTEALILEDPVASLNSLNALVGTYDLGGQKSLESILLPKLA